MATVNPYFAHNNSNNDNEIDLVHGFVTECIQIKGYEMIYVTRDLEDENIDRFFGEHNLSVFDNHHHIEMYIQSVDAFGGSGDLVSMFGVNIKDQVRLQVSRRRFLEVTGFEKPREGDLVFFPFNKQLFQIKFVEDEEQFYPLTTLPSFVLICELFDYSSERFETGDADLDAISAQSLDFEELDSLEFTDNDDTDYAEREDEEKEFLKPVNENVWGKWK